MGLNWVLSAPGGPHGGPMNLVISGVLLYGCTTCVTLQYGYDALSIIEYLTTGGIRYSGIMNLKEYLHSTHTGYAEFNHSIPVSHGSVKWNDWKAYDTSMPNHCSANHYIRREQDDSHPHKIDRWLDRVGSFYDTCIIYMRSDAPEALLSMNALDTCFWHNTPDSCGYRLCVSIDICYQFSSTCLIYGKDWYIVILFYNRTCETETSVLTKAAWWRHQMETFSASLAIYAGNSPVTGESPAQRSVTRSFDVFFDLRLSKRLSKQSWGWWFETLSHPLWRTLRNKLRWNLKEKSIKWILECCL